MNTYDACKKLIENGRYGSKEDMLLKLDIFLLGNRITQAEYNQLVDMLNNAT
ncbi:hypothetical protein [Ureibacillus sp. FSL K6-2830]|uniref:hypothetical protein n=1 Tax=Ureibacillus sp. FSL K6-2830 TaxID=2954610 RepID=UPI0030F6F4EF